MISSNDQSIERARLASKSRFSRIDQARLEAKLRSPREAEALAINMAITVFFSLVLLCICGMGAPFLLGADMLASWITSGVLGVLSLPLARKSCDLIEERVISQSHRREARLAELRGWRPHTGSLYAPHGTQACYLLAREPADEEHLKLSLQRWSMRGTGWKQDLSFQGCVSRVFSFQQEEEMREFEQELRAEGERLNELALDQAAEQASLSEQAKSFVRLNQGTELVV